jgi:ABC-2 type transport system ATP-binding protein
VNDKVNVRDWTHRFGRKRALDRAALTVPAGSVTALVGPNGSGKSTLLAGLGGLLDPCVRSFGSRVRVLGLDPFRRGPKVRKRVGWVPDLLEVPDWMTVGEHRRALARFHRRWDEEVCERLSRPMDVRAEQRVSALSKGQRAGHAVACALAQQPELLLLDEPFEGLDPSARRRIFDAVLAHFAEDGERSVLFSSQSMAEVERLADRVVFLQAGRTVFETSLEELLTRSARVEVELADPETAWQPPGEPRVLVDDGLVELFYLHWDEELERALAEDPRVRGVRQLARSLDEIFLATTESER